MAQYRRLEVLCPMVAMVVRTVPSHSTVLSLKISYWFIFQYFIDLKIIAILLLTKHLLLILNAHAFAFFSS